MAFAVASLSLAVAWYQLTVRPYRPPAEREWSAPSPAAAAGDGVTRDTQIAVWRQALAADTGSALVLSQLAALHAQRARETGAFNDYLDAEQLARHALTRRLQRNGAAAVTLVNVLLAQHRFTDAMAVADSLVQREPDIPSYQALRGEVAMELGRYAVADSVFTYIRPYRTQAGIAPRVARWLELHGRVAEARDLLRSAWQTLAATRDTPRETLAWFALRSGDLELRAGRPRAAADAYRRGLAIRPADPRLLAAMARLAIRAQRPTAARVWAERAVAAQTDVTTLLTLAEAQEAAGDSVEAAHTADAVQLLVSAQGGPPHREWLLWQLNHRAHVSEVLAMASADLTQRRDIYAYDLVGWAMAQQGDSAQARAMLQHAATLGTRDPLLTAHREALLHE